MPSTDVLLFIVAAMVAGGLSMGGVTLIHFRDKWRVDAVPGGEESREPEPAATREAA